MYQSEIKVGMKSMKEGEQKRTWPSASIRIFSGFRSLCIIPFEWRWETAETISAAYMRARSSLNIQR
jgi:hypothetical protein